MNMCTSQPTQHGICIRGCMLCTDIGQAHLHIMAEATSRKEEELLLSSRSLQSRGHRQSQLVPPVATTSMQ